MFTMLIEPVSISHSSMRFSLALPGTILLLLLSLRVLPFQPIVSYTLVFVLSSAIYLWMARALFAATLPHTILLILIATSLLVRLSFIGVQPIGSDDVYRYQWEGKVQSAGINPYLYAPDAPELRHLHSTLLPAAVNHPDMKTIYFPVAQWFSFVAYQISGEAIWGFKLILLFAETFTLWGLFLLTTRLKIPNSLILLYALCPLPILQFGLDAHVDGLGFPFLVWGLLLYSQRRRTPAYVLLGLAISIKPVALVFLPVLLFLEQGLLAKIRAALIPGIILLIQFLPYLLSSSPFDALITFSRHWTFNGLVFETLDVYFQDNAKTRLVCAALLCIALIWLWMKRADTWDRIYYAVLLLLLFSPVVHPWYVTWLAVLLPIARKWSGIVYVATVSLTGFTVLSYRTNGVWEQHPAALAVEYLPVILLMAKELFFQRTKASENDFPPEPCARSHPGTQHAREN
jgi:hypothetical protein